MLHAWVLCEWVRLRGLACCRGAASTPELGEFRQVRGTPRPGGVTLPSFPGLFSPYAPSHPSRRDALRVSWKVGFRIMLVHCLSDRLSRCSLFSISFSANAFCNENETPYSNTVILEPPGSFKHSGSVPSDGHSVGLGSRKGLVRVSQLIPVCS